MWPSLWAALSVAPCLSVWSSVPCHSAKQESLRNFWFGVKFIVNIVLDKSRPNWGAHLISREQQCEIVSFYQWKCFVFWYYFVRNPQSQRRPGRATASTCLACCLLANVLHCPKRCSRVLAWLCKSTFRRYGLHCYELSQCICFVYMTAILSYVGYTCRGVQWSLYPTCSHVVPPGSQWDTLYNTVKLRYNGLC